jgi:hypothetical protein
MKAKMRVVVFAAIETGIRYGMTRAFKHTDSPEREAIGVEIENAITNELDEVIDWEEDGDAIE